MRRSTRTWEGDLILAEVLQGLTNDKDFNQAKKLLTSLVVIDLGGRKIARKAAANFRALRAHGVTVRKTIDTLIATRCIESGLTLLHSDRDFEPFVSQLGPSQHRILTRYRLEECGFGPAKPRWLFVTRRPGQTLAG